MSYKISHETACQKSGFLSLILMIGNLTFSHKITINNYRKAVNEYWSILRNKAANEYWQIIEEHREILTFDQNLDIG